MGANRAPVESHFFHLIVNNFASTSRRVVKFGTFFENIRSYRVVLKFLRYFKKCQNYKLSK